MLDGISEQKRLMKKLIKLLMSACLLIGFVSCQSNGVTEGNLVGKWQLQTVEADGEVNPDGAQVWNFTAEHELYVSPEGRENEYVNSGTWSLNGKSLTTQFSPVPFTVNTLTSTTLVLTAPESKLTFKKVQ